jgi:hypothetical protein
MDKLICEQINNYGDKCTRKAIYYIDNFDGTKELSCGNCSRRYLPSVIHPLRMRYWGRANKSEVIDVHK